MTFLVLWDTVQGDQVAPGLFAGSSKDYLGQICEFCGKTCETLDLSQDMPHVDAEHLAILKLIQPILPRRSLHACFEFSSQVLPALGFLQRLHIPHDRKEILILHAQEVIPQELGYSQQTSQCVEDLRTLQRGQLVRPRWSAEQFSQVFVEVKEGRFRVGRSRE